MSESAPQRDLSMPARAVAVVGHVVYALADFLLGRVRYLGGVIYLLYDIAVWVARSIFFFSVRMNWSALMAQMVRVGFRSIGIIILVQSFIGVILALQMAPTLRSYGQLERVADIVGIAMFRELGPLLSAVVLSGFAGASIAAEIGAMVESEEIKALRAHALNPIRFLVMPRVLATIVMLTGLTVLADVVGVAGGLLTSWLVLDIEPNQYLYNTKMALLYRDFYTGLIKAAVFGLEISLLACYEGLNVRGGAVGVGRATTNTVVKSIVVLIVTDTLFTTVFYIYNM